MDEFYVLGSDEHYHGSAWVGERQVLEEESSVLLRRRDANKLRVNELFEKNHDDDKPHLVQSYYYIPVPYELDDEVMIGGKLLIDELLELSNRHFLGDIYVASTDFDKCCVVRTKELTERVIWAIPSGHLNTPFVVFDNKKDFFLLLDFDFPIQIIGYKPGLLDFHVVKKWHDFFNSEWDRVTEKYSSYTAMRPIISEYYSFLNITQK